MVMIRMRPDGTLEFDSADEAVEFQHKKALIRAAKAPSDRTVKATIDAGTGARWGKLMELVGSGKQLQFLQLLRDNPDGVTREMAMTAVGVDNANALAGVVGGGIAKNIATAGLDRRDIYLIEVRDGAKRYRPGPLLLKREVERA
jgi:hypothetical protein